MVVTLLLIDKGAPFNDSYRLMRVLEWKFGVGDSKQILDFLKEKKLVTYELINKVHYYTLTEQGRQMIQNEYTVVENSMRKEYPHELEFINGIFDNSNF